MDLEKTYDRVNREEIWEALRMYNATVKILNGTRSMYANSLACARLKRGETVCFRIDSCCETRLYHIPLAFQYMYGLSEERSENKDGEDGSEISRGGERIEITLLLYADDFV